jgi:hypothetical protein
MMLNNKERNTELYALNIKYSDELLFRRYVLLVPRNFSRGRKVIPSLAEREEQSCQRGYFQFGM